MIKTIGISKLHTNMNHQNHIFIPSTNSNLSVYPAAGAYAGIAPFYCIRLITRLMIDGKNSTTTIRRVTCSTISLGS